MDTLQIESTPKEHTFLITDVRFRPNSTQLATSSFDRIVRLWNATEDDLENNPEPLKGFSITEVAHMRISSSKVVCCGFSSDGKILASGRHKKAVLWNMDTLQIESTPEEHTFRIIDVHFRPNSTQLATSSFDRIVRLWNAAEGHRKEVWSLRWDNNREFLASVSVDSVKVWLLASGECIRELGTNMNNFHCCVFHPKYLTLLVIGRNPNLELWNTMENQIMTVPVHDGLIACLAAAPATGMVASASHDKSNRCSW